jgi:ribosome biogenesis GTPase / thiamine phosphate phosphatase
VTLAERNRAQDESQAAGMTRTTAGLVTAAHRRHYAVHLDDGETVACIVRGRNVAIACGDRVDVERSPSNEGTIVSVAPRTTLFFRSDIQRDKLLAANVTQVLGFVAPDPPYDDELVHRWIIAAESNGCSFVLVANKQDLPAFALITERLAQFAALGYPVVPMCANRDVSAIVPFLEGERSVLIGQSGMGKSTLINTLLPDAGARVGELSRALHTGRHTTTETTLYELDNGWIVDSPGMKEFGLGHLDADSIESAFIELRPLLGTCRFRNCRHDAEPGCAVQDAVARGVVKPWRAALLLQLRAESKRRTRTWA